MAKTQKALTPTGTSKDEGFERTALIMKPYDDEGSVDIVDEHGSILARVNIFRTESCLMVDVIDVKHAYTTHRALGFTKGGRAIAETETLVGAHFQK